MAKAKKTTRTAKKRRPKAVAKPRRAATPQLAVAYSAREIAELSEPPYPQAQRRVEELLRRLDCPFDSNVRARPVVMAEWFAWYDRAILPRRPGYTSPGPPGGTGGGLPTLGEAKLRVLLEDALLKRKRREILEERVIRREEHVRVVVDLVRFVRDSIEQWIEALPAQMDRLDAEQRVYLREGLNRAYDQLCTEMQAATAGRTTATRRASTVKKNPAKVKAARKRHGR